MFSENSHDASNNEKQTKRTEYKNTHTRVKTHETQDEKAQTMSEISLTSDSLNDNVDEIENLDKSDTEEYNASQDITSPVEEENGSELSEVDEDKSDTDDLEIELQTSSTSSIRSHTQEEDMMSEAPITTSQNADTVSGSSAPLSSSSQTRAHQPAITSGSRSMTRSVQIADISSAPPTSQSQHQSVQTNGSGPGQTKNSTTLMEKDIFESSPNEHFPQPVKKRVPINYVEMCTNLLTNFETIAVELKKYQDTIDDMSIPNTVPAKPNMNTEVDTKINPVPESVSVIQSKNKKSSLRRSAVEQTVTQTTAPEYPEEKFREEKVTSKTCDITTKLVQMSQDVELLRRKLQQISNIGKCFNRRDLMLSAFSNTSQNFVGTCPIIKGDFNRKSLECPCALEDLFDDGIFGNPIGSDINFVFTDVDVVQIVLYMDKLRKTTERPITERLMFGSFRLDKIYRDDMLIRRADITEEEMLRYTMVMTDTASKPEISIKCHVVSDLDDADVRVQLLECACVHNIIPDIVLRRIVHSENVTKYVKKLTESMTRERRIIVWEFILRVLEKDIQYLNQGYRYVDIGENKMIKISIEETELCPITMMPPPYTKIHLACEHQFSIMAIYGIVYEGKSNDTESIVCPVCRRNLIPKLVPAIPDSYINEFTVKTYKEKDIDISTDISEYKFEECDSKLNIVKTQNHTESNKYIDAIFNKTGAGTISSNDDTDSNDDSFLNYSGEPIIVN